VRKRESCNLAPKVSFCRGARGALQERAVGKSADSEVDFGSGRKGWKVVERRPSSSGVPECPIVDPLKGGAVAPNGVTVLALSRAAAPNQRWSSADAQRGKIVRASCANTRILLCRLSLSLHRWGTQ